METRPGYSSLLVHFWMSLLILLLCIGCSSNSTLHANYQPDSVQVDQAAWEEHYPRQYKDWAKSEHGEAYLSGDTNAPTCNDCHEVPAEGEVVKSAALHLETPARCARCHSDSELMAEYDIADDVVETYLADFHGTTINYYAKTAPTTIRSEAVCSDCHGSHGVYGADDQRSSVNEVNLQATCAKCHTNTTEAFTSAYGHYRPVKSPASSESDSTIVFITKLFYQAIIPITLGGMLAYIGLDVVYRFKRKKSVQEAAADHDENTMNEKESEG